MLAAAMMLGLAPLRAALREDQPPPYIGTPPRVIERMLTLARVRSSDMVMDLGSGDGRIVLEAARRFGAHAVGIEMNASLVEKCQQAAQREGLAERAACRQEDIFNTDLSPASVLTLYLSPEFNERLSRRILQNMRPGARVVSHDFAIGGWTPDVVEQMQVPEKNFGRGGESTIFLFTVPANAAGRWRAVLGEGASRRQFEFSIAQQFQMIEGALHGAQDYRRFAKASLHGDRIAIEVTDPGLALGGTIAARVDGERMAGTYRPARGGTEIAFSAERVALRPALF